MSKRSELDEHSATTGSTEPPDSHRKETILP